jgi:hypothetical protein
MKNEVELKIIELIDDGATPENSSELKNIIKSSQEAEILYKNILASDKLLKGFFGTSEAKELDNVIDISASKKVKLPSKKTLVGSKSIIGFAIAASLAVVSFTFFNSAEDASELVDLPLLAYEDSKPLMDEVITEPEPILISGTDITTLWSLATSLSKNLGFDRYKVMYALYQGNKESFLNNDINSPRSDRDFILDMSIVKDVDVLFATNEVKRHIFCSC